jgi:hypothetical protein
VFRPFLFLCAFDIGHVIVGHVKGVLLFLLSFTLPGVIHVLFIYSNEQLVILISLLLLFLHSSVFLFFCPRHFLPLLLSVPTSARMSQKGSSP